MTYRDWTKIDLREELRDRGLSRAGSREELVARLRAHDASSAAAAEPPEDTEAPGASDGDVEEPAGREFELDLPMAPSDQAAAPGPAEASDLELPDESELDEVVAEVAELDVPGIAEEVANGPPPDVVSADSSSDPAADGTADGTADGAADEAADGAADEVDAAAGPPAPLVVARRAVEALTQLTGRRPDGISGLRPLGGGWRLEIEVVEVSRGPAETDVLDTYEVVVDTHGGVERYDRIRRYVRGKSWEGGDVH